MTSSVIFQNLKSSGEICSICWNKLQNNEKIIGHKYGSFVIQQHEYHRSCIISWFKKGRDTCPLCNARVSNVDQYLLSLWEVWSENIRGIIKSGILVAAVNEIMREILTIVISDNRSLLISSLAVSILSQIIIQIETTGLPKIFNYIANLGMWVGFSLTNESKPEFQDIALICLTSVITTEVMQRILGARENAIIDKLVIFGLSFGVTVITNKIVRIAIAQLFGFIAK